MRLSVRTKLLGGFGIVALLTAIVGVFGILQMSTLNDNMSQIGTNDLPSVENIDAINSAVYEYRGLQQQHILSQDPAAMAATETALTAKAAEVDKLFGDYASLVGPGDDQRLYDQAKTQWADYVAKSSSFLAPSRKSDTAAASAVLNVDAKPALDALDATLVDWTKVNHTSAGDAVTSSNNTFNGARILVLIVIAIAVGLALLIGWVLSRAISRGLKEVQVTLASLAERCATSLAEGMARLSDNDLTYDVQPVTPAIERYGSDEIGQTAASTNLLRDKVVAAIGAYNEARAGLSATMTEVQSAAESVTRTSEQLNEAASQTGAATQQVAQTIGQVAGGTAEQARAASDTNAAVQALSGVITQVGMGADQASSAVGRSLEAVEAMQQALTASDQAAEQLKPANERAAVALEKVTAAIADNAAGMARIKTAVDESAVKVAELGAKGDQIGAIVETIDDIAEQTNLLALNAAIEAARAGEMGKGFAVVADEVRKLAERSGRATKEIASLIAEVQKGTSDAVAAMSAGAGQVEQGLEIGRRQSAAVVEVGDATVVRNAALDRVFDALGSISRAAAEVTASSDEIARVVAETASGAAAMASSSDTVTRSISSIAAVSEENSAAAEEVSAATEEMSAQAEEVVASAATLADMAAGLDALVARFRLAGTAAQPPVRQASRPSAVPVPSAQRRPADWQRKAS